jgi:flagellar biogenesis protein FliO
MIPVEDDDNDEREEGEAEKEVKGEEEGQDKDTHNDGPPAHKPPPYTSFAANPINNNGTSSKGKRKKGSVVWCLRVLKMLKSVGGLAILLLAYTFIGAWIMMRIEGPEEDAQKAQVREVVNVLTTTTMLRSNKDVVVVVVVAAAVVVVVVVDVVVVVVDDHHHNYNDNDDDDDEDDDDDDDEDK